MRRMKKIKIVPVSDMTVEMEDDDSLLKFMAVVIRPLKDGPNKSYGHEIYLPVELHEHTVEILDPAKPKNIQGTPQC